MLALPLPEGQYVVWPAWSGCTRSTGAATRTTRRSPSARATRSGCRRGSPSTAGGRRSATGPSPWTAAELGRGRRAAHPPARGAVRAVPPGRPDGAHPAAQPAVGTAGPRPPGLRRALRAGGAGLAGGRRLVRRLPAARRRDRAGDRRRRRARHRGRGLHGPAARAAARHHLRQRGRPGRGAHPAGPGDRRAAAEDDGRRCWSPGWSRPTRSGRPGSPGCAGPTPGTCRRWSPDPTARIAVLDAARPDLLLGRRRHRTAPGPGGSPSPAARRCCSTPTASSSAATSSSTTASSRLRADFGGSGASRSTGWPTSSSPGSARRRRGRRRGGGRPAQAPGPSSLSGLSGR